MRVAALLVGINNYKSVPLRGCVPDIRSIFSFLEKHRGLTTRNTAVLLDNKAKRRSITNALRSLAQEGPDIAYFIYSGHGTRLRDTSGDETETKFDQAICPYDYETQGLILDERSRVTCTARMSLLNLSHRHRRRRMRTWERQT